MSTTTFFTADQLLHMPDDGYRYELVSGELRRMTPAGWEHGMSGGQLYGLLAQYVLPRKLGALFLAETGFLLARDPDTVRAPDIAFVRKERIPAVLPKRAFWPGPPDLAVEVVSPGDTPRELSEKVRAWLDAGTALVWLVDPVARTVTVFRSTGDIKVLSGDDELSGEEIIPGFRCRVREIFATV